LDWIIDDIFSAQYEPRISSLIIFALSIAIVFLHHEIPFVKMKLPLGESKFAEDDPNRFVEYNEIKDQLAEVPP
jgi:hypothetical protein